MTYVLLIGFAAFLICFIFHIIALKLFPKLHLLDHPDKYGLERKRLPYPTGILAVLTFAAIFIATRENISLQDGGLLLCIGILAIMTIIDDLHGLPAWFRLCIQILIGFLLFATGTRIYTITNPLGGIIQLDTINFIIPSWGVGRGAWGVETLGPLPVFSGIFTIAWLLLTMNAFNWFDGIPGQVSSLSVIGALTIGLLSLSDRVNQPIVAAIAFAVAGIALSCAVFDFPPNRVVLGDTGAMFFGLMLGTLSIYAGGKVATAFLVLGLPLVDSMLVIFRRIRRRESPFKGNLDHLHHRLQKKGWSDRRIIALTATLGSAFGVTALFLNTFQKFIAMLLLVVVILCLTRFSRPESPLQD